MSSATHTLTEEQKGAGWKRLFDGEHPAGWRGFKRDDFPAGWQIVDGTLHRADKAGDIITVDQYDDFELSIEWRVEGPGNSGIFFHVTEDQDTVWQTGPEYQILNNEVPPDGRNTTGHIALQDHNDAVWYRNIFIREL